MSDKRKKHAAGFKAKVAIEALQERDSVRELSVRHGIHSTQINMWKTHLKDQAISLFEQPSAKSAKAQNKDAELYEEIGRLKMEINWLKKKHSDIGL